MSDVRVALREDVTPMLRKITAELARQVPAATGPLVDSVRDLFRKRFESQGAYGGTRWPDLSPATLLQRARQGLGNAVLDRWGTLEASFTQEGSLGLTVRGKSSSRALGYAVLEADGLHVGSNDPVLNLTERGTRKMPARPVLPDEIPAEFLDRWSDIVASGLGIDR